MEKKYNSKLPINKDIISLCEIKPDEFSISDTIEDKISCLCDRLASVALVNTVAAGMFISSCFPFEDLRLLVNGWIRQLCDLQLLGFQGGEGVV